MSFGQITINQQDLPQPGDTFLLNVDKTPSVSLGNPSSVSQIWNFLALNNDSNKYATYGITANLPFASSFPQSNSYTYGPAVLYGGPGSPSPGAGIGYTMWAVNNTGMWVIGHRTDYDGHGEKNIFVTPNEMLMPVPSTYGLNQDYDSQWEVLINYVATDYDTLYRSRTHKNINIDAWGSMSTPYGSFADVIRVHEFSVTTDSIFVKSGNIILFSMLWQKDTINKYLFWAPNERHPVAIAYCNGIGTLQRIEYVSWAHLSVPETKQTETSVNVFPNPSSNFAEIKLPANYSNENYFLVIYDMVGKEILHKIGKCDNIMLNVENINKGAYTIKLKTDSGKLFYSKLIVN